MISAFGFEKLLTLCIIITQQSMAISLRNHHEFYFLLQCMKLMIINEHQITTDLHYTNTKYANHPFLT